MSPPTRYCVCRKPEKGFMIYCDGCNECFHGACVNLSQEQANEMNGLCVWCTAISERTKQVEVNLKAYVENVLSTATGTCEAQLKGFVSEKIAQEVSNKQLSIDKERDAEMKQNQDQIQQLQNANQVYVMSMELKETELKRCLEERCQLQLLTNELGSKLRDREAELKQRQDQNTELQGFLKQLTINVEKKDAELKSSQDQIQHLQNANQVNVKSMELRETELNSCLEERCQLQLLTNQLGSKLQDREDELKQCQDQNTELQDFLKQLTINVEKKDAELKSSQDQIQHLQNANSKLFVDLKQREAELRHLKEEKKKSPILQKKHIQDINDKTIPCSQPAEYGGYFAKEQTLSQKCLSQPVLSKTHVGKKNNNCSSTSRHGLKRSRLSLSSPRIGSLKELKTQNTATHCSSAADSSLKNRKSYNPKESTQENDEGIKNDDEYDDDDDVFQPTKKPKT